MTILVQRLNENMNYIERLASLTLLFLPLLTSPLSSVDTVLPHIPVRVVRQFHTSRTTRKIPLTIKTNLRDPSFPPPPPPLRVLFAPLSPRIRHINERKLDYCLRPVTPKNQIEEIRAPPFFFFFFKFVVNNPVEKVTPHLPQHSSPIKIFPPHESIVKIVLQGAAAAWGKGEKK